MVAEVGFPFTGALDPTDRVHRVDLPEGRAVIATHIGSYQTLADTWHRTEAWMRERGLEVGGAGWESYLTAPEDPGPPVTQIVFPLR